VTLFCRLVKSVGEEADLAKLVDVNFDIEWTAITRYFDFDVDLDPRVLCDAIARETWTRGFFNNLRAYVSCHLSTTALHSDFSLLLC